MGWSDHYMKGMGCYIPANRRPKIPEAVRQEVRKRANYRCEGCGAEVSCDMHHTTYGYMFSDQDLTPAEDFRYLCRHCHQAAHRDPFGGWWTDPEEMEDMFYGYHKAMEED